MNGYYPRLHGLANCPLELTENLWQQLKLNFHTGVDFPYETQPTVQ